MSAYRALMIEHLDKRSEPALRELGVKIPNEAQLALGRAIEENAHLRTLLDERDREINNLLSLKYGPVQVASIDRAYVRRLEEAVSELRASQAAADLKELIELRRQVASNAAVIEKLKGRIKDRDWMIERLNGPSLCQAATESTLVLQN